MNAQHTPTPWEIGNVTYQHNFECWTKTVSAKGTRPLVGHRVAGRTEAECNANAAFIVRAVNAHDELVAALRFAKESIVQNRTLDEARNDHALNEAMVAVENRISAALAKAGA